MNENIEFFLGNIHWIDAYPNDKAFTNLVIAVKNALGVPVEENPKIPASVESPIPSVVNSKPHSLTKLLKWVILAAIAVIAIGVVLLFNRPKTPNAIDDGNNNTSELVSIDSADGIESVIINGVKWATRNVGKSGTLVAKPENAGMFFQWNRKQAWAITGDVTDWNNYRTRGG